ncbi:MAG: hypothetical protein IKY92_09855 [Akkermansia sp.]|nr:hypothetical protein [Akkermansia sp.]
MARKRRSSKNKKSQLPLALGGGGAVLLLAIIAAVVMKPSENREDSSDARFRVADYRYDASRLTGNSYTLTGRVENIETLGNDRMVAVSLPNNPQERLPLLVRSGVTGRVNLTRGDTFTFHVVCRNGHDSQGGEVKGIMVVEKVEAE